MSLRLTTRRLRNGHIRLVTRFRTPGAIRVWTLAPDASWVKCERCGGIEEYGKATLFSRFVTDLVLHECPDDRKR